MTVNLFLLLLLLCLPLCSLGKHLLRFLTFCQKQVWNDGQFDIEYDGDQLLYVEPYEPYRVFQRLPEFAHEWIPDPGLAKETFLSVGTCKYNLGIILQRPHIYPEVIDMPNSLIYPKNEIEIGAFNTLICFINDFHPPEVDVIWTKNGELVDESDVSQNQYYSNSDFTFRTASYLGFTPQENDIYACSVGHVSLQAPLTKFYEVEALPSSINVETVTCICGVLLGLMGVYLGFWFIRKANKSCQT